MLKITKIVSGIHIKDYRKCIRDTVKDFQECIRNTYQGLQKVYKGYMLEITESVSGIRIKNYWEFYQGYMLNITEIVSGIRIQTEKPRVLDWLYLDWYGFEGFRSRAFIKCLFVCPIITQESLDLFASIFDWRTRENQGNVLSMVLRF